MRRVTVLLLLGALAPCATAAPPAPFYPQYRAFLVARHYAAHRLGDVSFAVMRLDGRLWGLHAARREPSASVVKAMLLAAYLRHHHHLSPAIRPVLSAMIRVSDNGAAVAIHNLVGDAGLREVGRLAGMRHLLTGGPLFDTQITAADQARFFFHLDRVIPPWHLVYAKTLLRTVTGMQSWGIPAAARPLGWRVFFKGGWRNGLTHQAAQLLGATRKVAIAVLTRHTSMGYAEETISGITRRLLRRYPVATIG